jgi:hypothetical protein
MSSPKTPPNPLNPAQPSPEEISKGIQASIDATRAAVAAGIPPAPAAPTAADMAQVMSAGGITPEILEHMIEKLLTERKAKAIAEFIPKEPDYKTLSEKDIASKDIYIPVIEHDLPDYMNMVLADDEYVPIWVNRDQRQVGTKQAEGYEFLEKKHIAPDFHVPLKFNSEGQYVYQDVVCMRVHKRIRFAKLRKYYEISRAQLKPAQAQENAKSQLMEKVILGDPALDAAFASGAYKFYHTEP